MGETGSMENFTTNANNGRLTLGKCPPLGHYCIVKKRCPSDLLMWGAYLYHVEIILSNCFCDSGPFREGDGRKRYVVARVRMRCAPRSMGISTILPSKVNAPAPAACCSVNACTNRCARSISAALGEKARLMIVVWFG